MKFRTEFERQQAFAMAEIMKNEALKLSEPTAAAAAEPQSEPTKTTTTKKAKS